MSNRKLDRIRRMLIVIMVLFLVAAAAVTAHKVCEYSAGTEYYDSLRNIGGQ